jgi:putative PIN family toxin of toxin-antitoxin system
MAQRPRVVLDTNVVVAGLRSRRGASFRVLAEVGTGRFEIALSVPLVLEYEDVLRRGNVVKGLSGAAIDALLDYFCSTAHRQPIFYLWRPLLPDPKDDLVLELTVAAECRAIVTHNLKHFLGAESFGVSVLTPAAFLRFLGVIP